MESKKAWAEKMQQLSSKKKDIEVGINVLNSKLSDRKNELADADNALIDVRERFMATCKELESFDEYVDRTVSRVGVSMQLATSTLQCVDTIASGILSSAKAATEKLEGMFEEIAWAKTSLAEREQLIVAEEHRLAVLKSDLDIYRKRLQVKYNESGMGELIV